MPPVHEVQRKDLPKEHEKADKDNGNNEIINQKRNIIRICLHVET